MSMRERAFKMANEVGTLEDEAAVMRQALRRLKAMMAQSNPPEPLEIEQLLRFVEAGVVDL